MILGIRAVGQVDLILLTAEIALGEGGGVDGQGTVVLGEFCVVFHGAQVQDEVHGRIRVLAQGGQAPSTVAVGQAHVAGGGGGQGNQGPLIVCQISGHGGHGVGILEQDGGGAADETLNLLGEAPGDGVGGAALLEQLPELDEGFLGLGQGKDGGAVVIDEVSKVVVHDLVIAYRGVDGQVGVLIAAVNAPE